MPGKDAVHFHIASLVYQAMRNEKIPLNEAREKIADRLCVSLDTVRRAWRKFKDRAAAGAMGLHIGEMQNPSHFAARVAALKELIEETRASRRIPPNRQ